jgi:peptidoglycan/xylan/chitin deacetylase (PgdA/CDA1 family)
MILALLGGRGGLAASHYQPVPVLTYHRVGKAPHPRYPVPVISPQEFERQMAFLVQHGYHSVSPRELTDYWDGKIAKLPGRPILITFDDGWRDNYQNAYPILKRHHLTAVIFVTTGELGQRAMLRWPEVARLAHAGFTIGVHSQRHLRFGKLSAQERSTQMAASLGELRRRSGIIADTFAYPYGDGDLDKAVWSDVGRSGIKLAFASHNFGLNVRPPAPLAVRRVLMNGNRWLSDLTLNLLLW